MSNITEKYKRLIPKRIKITHHNIRNSSFKENETDLKLKKIINFLYLNKFHEIIIIQKYQFIQNILMNIHYL